MRLKGTVRNVVDFGAFVDVGVKQDGLLHRSRIPRGAGLAVGDVIDVTILSIDLERERISLGLAYNVTEPTSTGLGGDCFALFYDAKTQRHGAQRVGPRAGRAHARPAGAAGSCRRPAALSRAHHHGPRRVRRLV